MKKNEEVQLTDEQLEQVVAGGKYDLHGHGYNSGNGKGPNKELTDEELDNVVGGGKWDAHGHGINHGTGNGNGPKN